MRHNQLTTELAPSSSITATGVNHTKSKQWQGGREGKVGGMRVGREEQGCVGHLQLASIQFRWRCRLKLGWMDIAPRLEGSHQRRTDGRTDGQMGGVKSNLVVLVLFWRSGSNLPAVKRFPLAAPKVDSTTPMGIKKDAGPRTLLPQSYQGVHRMHHFIKPKKKQNKK